VLFLQQQQQQQQQQQHEDLGFQMLQPASSNGSGTEGVAGQS